MLCRAPHIRIADRVSEDATLVGDLGVGRLGRRSDLAQLLLQGTARQQERTQYPTQGPERAGRLQAHGQPGRPTAYDTPRRHQARSRGALRSQLCAKATTRKTLLA